MTDGRIRIVFRGTRGSIPVSGDNYVRYGGNTVSIEVHCGEHVLIFDAGSGLPQAGIDPAIATQRQFDLFFTHVHYDHIVGLPYFKPLYDPRAEVTVWSGHLAGTMSTAQIVDAFMKPPWFPVGPGVCKSHLQYRDFNPGDVLHPRPGITIRTGRLNHPGGAVGYRVEWGGQTVCIITDTEHRPPIWIRRYST